MFLEIVTPEAILFSSEVVSIYVPGVNGEFEMLNNHAPVVSILKEGTIKIESENFKVDDKFASKFSKTADGKISFSINSGTLELNDNKAIILAD
ncbi:F-type H+-transporting ATPase subunit epsilon [Lutibacter sp. Hel_I_33_5]|uniref:F0F1 ATP synthase subunit epsilon n=1 Tax=Lutibacter sp. Hel_I_33_5 TaxID=1566289 RepID=UPI0011A7B693|nr:F0F1 ATP synthase subunit epsilon [Lutibacter sp. Hel_I_33_5]TVZ56148.1 F-type H+-transporting ATPase subunit epsilon [Lutibacter sp. Hel_I_33_5]